MKILMGHTYYQRLGGEDLCFDAESLMLERHGHQVVRFTRRNDELEGMNKLAVAWRTLWNSGAARDLGRVLRAERPDVCHFTNTFPLLSPAVYYAARSAGVPVVQSLRNYRMMCPSAVFLREGKVCEECLGKSIAWPAIRYGCYRGHAGSAVVAAMLAYHRMLDTWRQAVTLFFTPSQFARAKHIEGGLPASRIAVKPDFLDLNPDPGPGSGAGGFALFIGRLSAEKGLDMLLEAWRQLGPTLPLRIVGDGPMRSHVEEIARTVPGVTLLGHVPHAEVLSLAGEATCLVMPSLWYETFGRTIIEAFARATPVVVARLGSMAELVTDGETGYTFEAGNVADLVAQVRRLLADAARLAAMRVAARQVYLGQFTAEQNYPILMRIYEDALARAGKRGKS